MRTTRRAAVTVLVIAASSLIVACVPPPTPPAPLTPAQASRRDAAAWLVRQFDPTTKVIESAFTPGTPDVGGTANAVTSLRIAGVDPSLQAAAVAALAPDIESFIDDPASDDDLPGSLARLILAVVAVGGNARNYAGTDLVARLEATVQPTGQFGTQDSTYDGAFRQGLALAALSVVTPRAATIDPGAGSIQDIPAVAWLRAQQCDDGSWQPIRTVPVTPCAFNPVTFSGPETNSTAMATLGLLSVGAFPVVDPNNWLTSIRSADGGWSYDGFGASDPDSTGLVMAARRGLGITPDTAAITTLRSFQFDGAAPGPEAGAFFYPPFSGPPVPNLLSTNDAMLGLSTDTWPGVLTFTPT